MGRFAAGLLKIRSLEKRPSLSKRGSPRTEFDTLISLELALPAGVATIKGKSL
jgi:hypothetical protein